MKLSTLLAAAQPDLVLVNPLPNHAALDAEITSLCTNSQACTPGSLFMGMPGTKVDGGSFWPQAAAAGAVAAIVSESVGNKASSDSGLVIPVANVPRACGAIATQFYEHPSRKLKLVGVTGTNGKTTTTHLIEYLLNESQKPTAILGTLYTRWPGFQETASHTTPFAVDLQARLAKAAAAGCQAGVMEVSSHALDQERVWGCEFEVAVFTNLTQDHLDYHPDMQAYFAAKSLLFQPNYLKGKAIINIDDPYGEKLATQLPTGQVWRYSTHNSQAELWTSDLVYQPNGVSGILHTPMGDLAFNSPLVGQFNVANLLAAAGACLQLGVSLATIAQALPSLTACPVGCNRCKCSPSKISASLSITPIPPIASKICSRLPDLLSKGN
jgi:UDP-N-acetylmuramoyl-L-alanyl-D-glutamate--2,6-diaminopimelate ligase